MKSQIVLVCLSFFILFNCSVIDELTKFDMDYETSYTLNPVPVVNVPISLFTPDIESNSETTFENNNTNKDLVESIKLKSLIVSIPSPETGNFNFLKQIRIYISTENVEETEVANLLDVPNDNSNTIDLDVLGKELEQYVKEDQFKLRIYAVADETTTEVYEIKFLAIFAVDAKILGI
ncbi:hypothetical protein [Algibacter sp.]|uniref:hypothetical protein n=1 Tax=Algibacter sp. TaxID=1872428 RepID=UPI003C70D288